MPRRLSHPSRRTIGLRVPDHRVTQALLELLGQPLLATTLIAPGETEPLNDPAEIRERLQKQVQAVVDAGACPMQPTTVIDLTGDEPALVRRGRGDPHLLGLWRRPPDRRVGSRGLAVGAGAVRTTRCGLKPDLRLARAPASPACRAPCSASKRAAQAASRSMLHSVNGTSCALNQARAWTQ